MIREDAARRLAAIGNASTTPGRVARVLRKLQRETARPSHRQLVAINAANDLLDAAAAHCFSNPVAATDLIRWNQMRRQPERVLADLDHGPTAFGELRIERDGPAVWSLLPEPRHEHVPAWARFRDAARTWLDVQQGREWSPPPAFPSPPPVPSAPKVAGEAPRAESLPAPGPPAPTPSAGPPRPHPRGRSPGPGLSR